MSGTRWKSRFLSCCPTQTAKIGPTWVKVHAATQEEEVTNKQDSTWEDIVSRQLPGGVEDWGMEDWDAEEDSQSAVEPQFEDATIEEEEDEEQVVIESVMEEELEQPGGGATTNKGTGWR